MSIVCCIVNDNDRLYITILNTMHEVTHFMNWSNDLVKCKYNLRGSYSETQNGVDNSIFA